MSQGKNNQKRRKDEAGSKRDIFGRNSSCIRSCLPSMHGIETIDLYSRELESGYSPLHISLKNGYLRKSYTLYKRWKDEMEFLSHKYGGHVMNQEDREGLKPLDLYNMEFQNHVTKYPRCVGYGKDGALEIIWNNDISSSSLNVKDSFMNTSLDLGAQNTLHEKGGSHMLTLGSNVNYQLGTGTKDDRQNMFQLGVNQLDSNNDVEASKMTFKKILMTRYHSIVLTSTDKIYTCGNGSRGRLGNGITDAPLLSFSEIFDFSDSGVSTIVSSNHHSLVLTNNYEIYSWGWNGYGQLGYSTNSRSADDKLLEKICGSVPKRVPFFDDKDIVTIACSKVHSCAVAENGNIYFWGLNLGQMGSSKLSHLPPDTEYEGQSGYVISTPLSFNLPNLSVQQVVCTDFATFIRSKNNTLHVYSNYMIRTFKIPLPRTKTFKEIDAFAHFSPREVPCEVIDMKCSNSFGNNFCFKYSCGRVGIISIKNESPKMWTQFTSSLPVTPCWIPNIRSKKCLDVAVSSKGNLLIATLGGDIFTCTGSNYTFEQIHSNKLVSGRSISVSCDPSFGSFAILKNESFEVPMIYPKDSLMFDFSQYSPLCDIPRTTSNIIWGASNTFRFKFSDYLHNFELSGQNEESLDAKKENFGLLPYSSTHLPKLTQRANNDSTYDVKIVNEAQQLICECHKLILLTRCSKLKKSLMNGARFVTKDGFIQLCLLTDFNENEWTIEAMSSQISSDEVSSILKQIIHFLYTDEKPQSHHIPKILYDLMDSSYHLTHLPFSLQRLLIFSSSKEKTSSPTNVLLELKDGVIRGHSLVLSSRCVFFQRCLKKQWCHANNQGLNVIKMDHIETASTLNMECILKYIYGVPYNEIFDKISFSLDTEYVQFFLDILELCDALNLECFKNYVESLAVKYMNGETVVPMLVNAVTANSRLLALNCCWYLCSHIGLLFIKDNIEIIERCFDDVIWNLLEGTLRNLKTGNQEKCLTPWYENKAIDWFKLFQTNLKEFNKHFMDPEFPFTPVIDLKSDIAEGSGGRSNKKASRRRSSNHSSSGNQQSLFTSGNSGSNRKPSVPSIAEPPLAWTSSGNNMDCETIVDAVEFIEVVKKPKRRTSTQTSSPMETMPIEPTGKVVVHKAKESGNENLPSLLSEGKSIPSSPGLIGGNDSNNLKITGTFKKSSQKQRRRQLTDSDTKKHTESSNTGVWGNGATSHPAVTSNLFSKGKKSLPSLYDSNSTTELIQTKKEKKKIALNSSTNAEFASHGNLSGITPYVHKASIAKVSVATQNQLPKDLSQFDNKPTPKPKLSLEERVAAQEFEKWFAQESAKVQDQLKKDNRKARDEMKLMYKAANNLPDFITDTEQQSNSKKGRKLKLKFRNRNEDDSLVRALQ